ncbi:hypothetical protein AB6A40_010292 [Gnathostoma spinigerum]|uniref:Alcohol dehydrogenase-like N-terminal domain-containing protein n=1 Tax=Gnathostoma spinigerum TaxID=75299 RepID=A0ABD6EUV1_9BILA
MIAPTRCIPLISPIRMLSTSKRIRSKASSTMSAWITRTVGSKMSLESVSMPEISRPDHILLKVQAASVNPIDTRMQRGYGRKFVSFLKQWEECTISPATIFPFIGGRDCCAVIEQTGQGVTKFKKGDQVMAVIPVTNAGCHAEYVLAVESSCVAKPKNLSHTEAASLPYVMCTAWSALVMVLY